MRPWVQWCIDHRLRWFLLIVLVVMLPVYLARGFWIGLKEASWEFVSDYVGIGNQPRTKR